MSAGKPRPILLAGPTASGKSALALEIAARDDGVILNADASQVYACWRLLTARPGDADLARAPHRLYGHVDGARRYSVGDWLRALGPEIAAAERAGRRPIVVGGTGLYFHTLTTGLPSIPEIPPEVRTQSQAMLDAGELDAMLAQLMTLDLDTYARIDRRNPMRVQRAWEVLITTGRGLASWHEDEHQPVLSPDAVVPLVLMPETDSLNRNIATRFHRMIEAGALDEAAAFAAAGYDPNGPSARVLGAPQLLDHLAGTIPLEAAVEASIVATRQFAKRQRTWFRNKMGTWPRLAPSPDALAAIPRD